MYKLRIILTFITMLLFTACSSLTASDSKPTATIVRLSDEALAQLTAEAATATAQPTPTTQIVEVATAIPTLTLTPVPTTTIVTSEVVSTAPITTATVLTTASGIKVEVVIGAINLRSGPGINYATNGSAVKGQQFDVLGTDTSRFWLNIATEKGTAWLSGKATYSRLLSGSVDELPIIQATAPITPTEQSSLAAPVVATVAVKSKDLDSQLVFMNHSGGELYRINLDGTGLKPLAGLENKNITMNGGVIDPMVSPNGQQVAFTRWDGANFGALYIAQVDGSRERLVMGDIRQPKSPTWSPDGTKLLISFQHGGLREMGEECQTFDRDDGMGLPKNITIIKRHVSNDGKLTICFRRNDDLRWALRIIDVATGQFDDISTDTYSISPTWNPNNANQVIYKDERNLVSLDMTQRKTTALFPNPSDGSPVFSPDGSKLALTYRQHDHWEVYTMDVATGARTRLTKPPILAKPQYNSAAPAWSPDGQQLAFVTDRNGTWEIWVMQADGSNPHALFTPEIQSQLQLRYDGMNERMLNWVGANRPL